MSYIWTSKTFTKKYNKEDTWTCPLFNPIDWMDSHYTSVNKEVMCLWVLLGQCAYVTARPCCLHTCVDPVCVRLTVHRCMGICAHVEYVSECSWAVCLHLSQQQHFIRRHGCWGDLQRGYPLLQTVWALLTEWGWLLVGTIPVQLLHALQTPSTLDGDRAERKTTVQIT